MNKLILAGLSCAGALALLAETAYAHGGQYRGPGDVVPPGPGGGRGSGAGGPATGGPSGPAAPGPAGPATPGSAGPATGAPAGPGGPGPATGGRGVQLSDDLSRWEFWWEFNKDPYIRLKDAIHANTVVSGSDEFFLGATKRVASRDSLAPSEEDKLNVILPSLKKAIDSTDQHDINSSCMVAMAKIGRDHPDFKLVEVFEPRLSKNSQEIRETAALALGIAALPEARSLDMLISLAGDTDLARKASDQPEINDRTRSFACYGLGLLAYANSDLALKRKAFEALRDLVNDDGLTSRNIKVAAINGIGLLNISASDDANKQLLSEALDCLEGYYMKKLGSGQQLLQSHVPPAIAKLLQNDHPDEKVIENFKDLFAADLMEKGKVKRSSNDIARSTVLALGQLCEPVDDIKADSDGKHVKLLLDSWNNHKDAQTRYFSMLALGQIGGKWVRSQLLKEFGKAGKSLEKPWVAMAMGVYAFEKYDRERAAGRSIEVEEEFGRTLQKALTEVKDPSAVSAFAVGLGLVQYGNGADSLRQMLVKSRSKDELAGYICIGLALMNDRRSIEDIRDIVQKSVRRPDLLKQAAIALGKLGDKSVADELQALLAEGDTNLAKLSAVASALGFIGDRRTIAPLKRMLQDDQLTDLSRAFAAVALGGVGDKEPLPWNSKIGQNMNYRASVETLTDRTAGILDIL
ncbi:MAG: HEAT repeat domain-containing protein [Planctomycetota bacterium]|nr:HEAT repeat domain-containing protein [Planctomycetota bacterium]